MLKEKIARRSAVIAILGLGYVGYPLACLFSKAGFKVIGYDVEKSRLQAITENKVNWAEGYSHNKELFQATDNPNDIISADIFIITVQTPLKTNNTPDLSYVESAADIVRQNLSPGKLVILESTTFPGTTEEVLKPILEKSGLVAGEDFYLVFSPERIDPGNPIWRTENIPKIVGGLNTESRELAVELYSTIVQRVVPVSSPRAAEAAKVMENVFRNINIALVNELAKVFDKLGIDVWEVINAAATKPFSFMPHYPGPGVGGHCIPKDPFYLSYKAKKEGIDLRFIELAGSINQSMPFYVLHLLKELLHKHGKDLQKAKIGVLGVTYKRDVPDLRDTPSKVIIEELLKSAAEVQVFDPMSSETFGARTAGYEEVLKDKDCILLLVDHSYFRKNSIENIINKLSPDTCVLDTKNFFRVDLFAPTVKYKCLGRGQLLK